MINEETKRKLVDMDMSALVNALEAQDKEVYYSSLTFEERLAAAMDVAYQVRYNNRIKSIIKRAHFRYPEASIENIYFNKRELNKDQIMSLSTNAQTNTAKNIIIQGFTGSGKTFLSNAIGKCACKVAMRVRYIRMPDLLVLLEEAELKKGRTKLINKFSNYQLLIIDEWLMNEMSTQEIEFIFEIIEKRYLKYSTIFCTQLKVENWHSHLGGGVHADAIMDRVIHGAITINSGDVNMREVEAKLNQ